MRKTTQVVHSKDQDMAVKDAMRVYVIPKVVNTWFNILCEYQNTNFSTINSSNTNSNNNSSNNNNEIAKCTLNVLQTYIEWIDIRLCTTPEWINLLFFLISFNHLRNAVLDVFISLVMKKQMPGMKMTVLTTLNVCEMMPRLVNMINEQQSNKSFSSFINNNINNFNNSSMIFLTNMKNESNSVFQTNSTLAGLASINRGSTSYNASEKDEEADRSISALSFA